IFSKLVRHVEKEFPKTEKSSMNSSMVCSIISWKIAIIHCWNVPGALHSPKVIPPFFWNTMDKTNPRAVWGRVDQSRIKKFFNLFLDDIMDLWVNPSLALHLWCIVFFEENLLRTKLRVDTLYVVKLPSDCLFSGFENFYEGGFFINTQVFGDYDGPLIVVS
nr:hypothetical protein [Tanacetum cinerariifolium]